MARFNDTTIAGNLSVTGKVTAQSFNATSDRRAKTNIEKYTPKASITDLEVYSYDYVDSGEHSIGCMADELLSICPDIVNGGNDRYLTIQETKIVYLLLMEIKELKKRVEELEAHLG